MLNESIGLPPVYQPDSIERIAVMLECGHHLELRKDSPFWMDMNIPLWCDVCAGEQVLHPLAVLEFVIWQEENQS